MGSVYRATDESLQRFGALKVISERKVEDDELRVEKLLQEARAQARVNDESDRGTCDGEYERLDNGIAERQQ